MNSAYFQRLVARDATVLDLGCGYGEFINQIGCGKKWAMDLNPEARLHLDPDVQLVPQDCSKPWPMPDSSLDVVFSSNFFEHLPDKLALRDTIGQAARCLRPGGRLVALGPIIKHVHGAYWDFWDHFLCLTERSLGEAFENNGFKVIQSHSRVVPNSTVGTPEIPDILIRAYLAMPIVWLICGKQFLVVAENVK